MLATMPQRALTVDAAGRAMRRVFGPNPNVRPAKPSPDAADELVEAEFAWRLVFAMAQGGHTEAAQALRDNVLALTVDTLAALDAVRAEATRLGHASPELARFDVLAAEVRRRYDYLFARWKTAEDLEYLAAESLAPTEEEFRRIQASLPFPSAWLEPAEKPF